MANTLYLGTGRVTTSMARYFSESAIAVQENQARLEIFEWDSERSTWTQIDARPGSFDSLDWNEFQFNRAVVSPGVDPRRNFFTHLAAREEREIDLFCDVFRGRVLAVTGSNGKSTFTLQFGDLLKRHLPHQKIFVGGNLEPACFEALGPTYDWAILELSSFQLERLKRARFSYGILLNLSRNHLDRYDRLEDYYDVKWNLLRRSEHAFYPKDSWRPEGWERPSELMYGQSIPRKELLLMSLERLALDIGFSINERHFENLPNLPHRLNQHRLANGACIVNDSKATTVEAALYAYKELLPRHPQILWALGGKDKGDDFSRILQVMRPSDEILLFGASADSIGRQLKSCPCPVKKFKTLRELCQHYVATILPGQLLLLSPACASFDEFKNFEDRGWFFLNQFGFHEDRVPS